MTASVKPPVAPMLARLSRTLPDGDDWLFEPKWDGFRCLVFRDGASIDLRSRNDRPLARYFPELATAISELRGSSVVLDGEILVVLGGHADFASLMARLHPAASRARRLADETPARFVTFDILALGGRDLRGLPFVERRKELDSALHDAGPPVHVTPVTGDRDTAARWLEGSAGGGLDGVVAKRADLPYEPGRRTMVKVKRERTAECVVAGYRVFADEPVVASLLLGVYDHGGALHHMGVASSFSERRRHELVSELRPLVTSLSGHPWEKGFGAGTGGLARLGGAASRWTPDLALDWIPLRPELVCEVAYDHVDSGRFRHPARFVRWRPDRDTASCGLEQLAPPADVGDLLR